LSITHHIRKRPSTGPGTTHGPQYFKVTSCLGTMPTLSITTSLSAQAKQSLRAR
jgi:hypothetical protein